MSGPPKITVACLECGAEVSTLAGSDTSAVRCWPCGRAEYLGRKAAAPPAPGPLTLFGAEVGR